ncbi:uncharacterized [Tachysurus ichikawai]
MGREKKSHLRCARWDWLDAPVKTTHLSFRAGRVQLTLAHGLPADDGSEKAGVSGVERRREAGRGRGYNCQRHPAVEMMRRG